MGNENRLNDTLADVVMARPREFFVGTKRMCLWMPSLGQSLMAQRHLENLGVDRELLASRPTVEAIRLAAQKRDEVCRLISLHTFRAYADLTNSQTVGRRADLLSASLDTDELAQLLLVVLSMPRAEDIISRCGLREQQVEQQRIAKVKNADGHTLAFGGTTMFGSLIVPACERLHLTPYKAVWCVPLVQLQMLLADAVTSVYLTDEERRRAHIRTAASARIDCDNPASLAQILAMDWS